MVHSREQPFVFISICWDSKIIWTRDEKKKKEMGMSGIVKVRNSDTSLH